MKNRTTYIFQMQQLTVLVGIVFLCCSLNVPKGQAEELPTTIVFKGSKDDSVSAAYFKTNYRGKVTFTHSKHIADYKIPCGKCHHDDSGEPLTNLKVGDELAGSCTDCHTEVVLLRGKSLRDTPPDELTDYYPNMIHKMCIGCHMKHNNKNHTFTVPEACYGCHERLELKKK